MSTSRDIKQVAGNPVDTGIGPAGQGTQRVAIANNEVLSVSGTVVTTGSVSLTGTATVVQGNSTGAPWIVSGTVTLSNPAPSVVQANQGTRGPEPWPVSGTVVVSNTVTTNATITNNPTIVQGNSTGAPWIISGTTVLQDGFTRANQGFRGPEPWPVSGTVVTSTTKPATSTVTPLTVTASSSTLLAANSSRLGAFIFNDSTQDLKTKLGATASFTSFTLNIGPGDFYEVQQPVYTGIIDGILSSGVGSIKVTEVTS